MRGRSRGGGCFLGVEAARLGDLGRRRRVVGGHFGIVLFVGLGCLAVKAHHDHYCAIALP